MTSFSFKRHMFIAVASSLKTGTLVPMCDMTDAVMLPRRMDGSDPYPQSLLEKAGYNPDDALVINEIGRLNTKQIELDGAKTVAEIDGLVDDERHVSYLGTDNVTALKEDFFARANSKRKSILTAKVNEMFRAQLEGLTTRLGVAKTVEEIDDLINQASSLRHLDMPVFMDLKKRFIDNAKSLRKSVATAKFLAKYETDLGELNRLSIELSTAETEEQIEGLIIEAMTLSGSLELTAHIKEFVVTAVNKKYEAELDRLNRCNFEKAAEELRRKIATEIEGLVG